MSRDEWSRTLPTRVALMRAAGVAWWKLAASERDAAVRAETRSPGAGADLIAALAADRPFTI